MTGAEWQQPQPGKQSSAFRRWLLRWYKVPLFLASLLLFVLAITFMKDGAGALGPLVRDRLAVAGFSDALGFGWLFSYLIMSGSPVAAAGLALFDAGVVDQVSAYGMVVGSRMGASFIVLFVGFLYVLRGRSRVTSLSMGLLSLVVAGSIQGLAIAVGVPLLQSGLVDGLDLAGLAAVVAPVGGLLDPVSGAVARLLPGWGLFLLGLGLILVSFNLFDRCLPQMTLKAGGVGGMAQFVYRPWVMFAIGSLVTLFSMSVSVSLSILVPLNQRGFVRRENIIPYMMGANITTFIDTLLAAALLQNRAADTVVVVEMVSLTAVSALILLIGYDAYRLAVLAFVDRIVEHRPSLALFMSGLFVIPIVLLLL